MVSATVRSAPAVRAGLRLGDYITLLKPKIIILMAIYGVICALLAGGGTVGAWPLALFTLSALMAAGAAACINHLFEQDIDRKMSRTQDRPVAAGRVSPRQAAWLAGILLAVGLPLAWAGLNWQVALQLGLGAAVYGGIYTMFLKRRTPWNIVIGGLAGSHMALAGWAVADPVPGPAAWLMAAFVFLWTPAHFWGLAIARDADYRRAGIPMLPQVAGVKRTALSMLGYAAVSWAVSVALVVWSPLGWVYGVLAFGLGLGFTAACYHLWRTPTAEVGWRVFKWSGMYLGLVLLAMMLDLLALG